MPARHSLPDRVAVRLASTQFDGSVNAERFDASGGTLSQPTMAKYYRNYVAGGTYFFTAVTYRRQPLLTSQHARDLLSDSFRTVRRRWPFSVIAIVLLPDHLHTVWSLPRAIPITR
jgi:hypothetical protein